MRTFRVILARLPLPMLALAASYGVYSFAVLFVPTWVAIVQAAAFELTYIGLAVTDGLTDQGRRRATRISVGAVVVSILYNTLAGLFHRNPEWLTAWGGLWEWGLALLHGAPLAWVAYLVADLLLHTESDGARAWLTQELQTPAYARPAAFPAPVEVREMPGSDAVERPAPAPAPVATASQPETPRKAHERTYTCKRCGDGPMSFAELGRHSRQCKREA